MHEITRIEVKTDVYGQEHKNYFDGYTEGDMDSAVISGDITIELSTLPSGARITIEYPECPNCGDLPEEVFNANHRIIGFKDACTCGYDWNLFRETKYG